MRSEIPFFFLPDGSDNTKLSQPFSTPDRALAHGRRLVPVVLLGASASHAAGDIDAPASVSGLPVPRFVSLKADRVNVRAGPNKDQEVRWVYTRAGMPVEITAEFENWRRIRDWEGAEGWVYHSLLSGKRSAVVVPTLKNDLVPLYRKSGRRSRRETARLQSGVLAQYQILQRQMVRVRGQGFRRLDRAGASLGRLSEREGGVTFAASTAIAEMPRREISGHDGCQRSRAGG